jgi:hypothetical protein
MPLKGRAFRRAEKKQLRQDLQFAEKVGWGRFVSGHDFSRAD